MLALMRRPYSLDYFRRLVDSIVGRLPHASIGTDMIVGFPGETDDDFGANLEYLPASPLSHVHVFPYSDRPGTAAARHAGTRSQAPLFASAARGCARLAPTSRAGSGSRRPGPCGRA